MLGAYASFPRNVHRIVDFVSSVSERGLQKTLIDVFCNLNKNMFPLEEITIPSLHDCIVAFEIGIAEDGDFNYLDESQMNRLLENIKKKPFKLMDFLCIMRYVKAKSENKKSPRFDYYMLRFTFDKKDVQLQVFHEKGPMHISQKDLPEFLGRRINAHRARKTIKIV